MALDTLAFIAKCVVGLAIVIIVLRGLWLDRRRNKVSYDIETDGFGNVTKIHTYRSYHKFK